MSIYYLSRKRLFREVRKRVGRPGVALDIGCGIRPQDFVKPTVHICCDPFKPYVQELQKRASNSISNNLVILHASWSDVIRMFPPGSVDTIFLIDVIEHLEKEEGRSILKETVPIARKHLVVFTPLGFLEQSHPDGKDAWGFDGGKWQEHRSGWDPEDFGEGWDSLVVKDFHQTDNLGEKYEVPKGAFVSIYTVENLCLSKSTGWNIWNRIKSSINFMKKL
jgi:hypothetical protein